MDGDGLRRAFLAILALGGVVLVGAMLRPFVPAILTSLVVVALAWPAYRPFRDWVGRPSVAALVGTAVLFLMVLLPVLGISLILFQQVRVGIDAFAALAGEFVEPKGRAWVYIEYFSDRIGMDPEEVTGNLTGQARDVAGTLAARTVGLFSGIGGWFLQTMTALFTIYYLLRDGEALAEKFKDAIPMERGLTERLMARATEVSFAAVFGSLVVAAAQGILGGVAFWALGLPAPVLWGLIMGLLSLLPVIGPFLFVTALTLMEMARLSLDPPEGDAAETAILP